MKNEAAIWVLFEVEIGEIGDFAEKAYIMLIFCFL